MLVEGGVSVDQAHPQRLSFRPRSSANSLDRETDMSGWKTNREIDIVASKGPHWITVPNPS